jgi:hypothetical protein
MHRLLSAGAEPAAEAMAESLGSATFAGRLFDLGLYPGAVPDPTGNWQVTGELYRLRRPESVLEALDQYEGCAPHSPQPHEYRRVLQPVQLANLPEGRAMCPEDRTRQAWVYILNAPLDFLLDTLRGGARQIESGDYLQGGKSPPGTGYNTGDDTGNDAGKDAGNCNC